MSSNDSRNVRPGRDERPMTDGPSGDANAIPRNNRNDVFTTTPVKSKTQQSFPALYQTPTTSTLGDESSWRPFASNASPSRPPPPAASATTTARGSKTPPRAPMHGLSGTVTGSASKTAINDGTATGTTTPVPTTLPQKQRRRGLNKGDFMHDENLPSVKIRTVNMAQRSVFLPCPPPSIEEWHAYVNSNAQIKSNNLHRKVSPSLQHLQLLHAVHQSRQAVPQLHFSSSTSLHADAHLRRWHFDDDPPRRGSNDGRYRCIEVRQALPQPAPRLSHRKHRLPMRADVGFPGATSDEIRYKQHEIQQETMWEETSPRLLVLVHAQDLGHVVHEAPPGPFTARHLAWNGGGVPGMPYAGRPLLEALARNARFRGEALPVDEQFLLPQRASMLAPPLDAMPSASAHWKPRPFHDKPPGYHYRLACPLHVQLDVNYAEPLICSLALYSLAEGPGNKVHVPPGKQSEEFWFPAGDWRGRLDAGAFVAVQREGRVDDAVLEAWLDIRKKAIFSYDPHVVRDDHLFVVLQVYKIAHREALAVYETINAGSKPTKAKKVAEVSAAAMQHLNESFSRHGVDFRVPLCYGLAPFDCWDDTWPDGDLRELDLHQFPSICDSQDAFVQRLLAHTGGLPTKAKQRRPSTVPTSMFGSASVQTVSNGSASVTSVPSAPNATPAPKKKTFSKFFKSPMRTRARSCGSQDGDQSQGAMKSAAAVIGSARLYLASLSDDILQSMLVTPLDLDVDVASRGMLPKLLTDVSGQYAVAMDADQPQQLIPVARIGNRKRSDLLKLPPVSETAGYVAPSEFRDVLFLPTRPEKQYTTDSVPSAASCLNLLFLYPHLLRSSDATRVSRLPNLAVRFKIIHTNVSLDDASGSIVTRNVALPLFHAVAAWTSSAMTDHFICSLPGNDSKAVRRIDLKQGLHFRDEVKIQLPTVLDGSFLLNVSLLDTKSIDTLDGMSPIAEVSVPLSSSSTRNLISGTKVTTIIPNGNHRLKLGDFQLQLETRLVSSIHVADPAVATCLRDAFWNETTQASRKVVNGTPNQSSFDAEADSGTLLDDASPGNVAAHLACLNLLNFDNMSNTNEMPSSVSSPGALNMLMSMTKLLDYFWDPGTSRRQLFAKAMVDSSSFAVSTNSIESRLSTCDSKVDSVTHESSSEDELDDKRSFGAFREEGTVITRSKHESTARQKKHKQKFASAIKESGAPLARYAYGVNKLNRLRLEAELRQDEQVPHIFDDDETIATSFSRRIESHGDHKLDDLKMRKKSIATAVSTRYLIEIDDEKSDNSLVRIHTFSTSNEGTYECRPVGETDFGARVKTAAQLMLAPCVGPSLSNLLAGSVRGGASTGSIGGSETPVSIQHSNPMSIEKCAFWEPGSDDEAENSGVGLIASGASRNDGLLMWTPLLSNTTAPSHGPFLYETMMLYWLKAIADGSNIDFDTTMLDSTKKAWPCLSIVSAVDAIPVMQGTWHMGFVLPLLLKALSVRVISNQEARSTVSLDDMHCTVICRIAEAGVHTALVMALSDEDGLVNALEECQHVIDFVLGLSAIASCDAIKTVLKSCLDLLRDAEAERPTDDASRAPLKTIRLIQCSRQLRLRFVEEFATAPSYVALNHPLKISEQVARSSPRLPTWIQQSGGDDRKTNAFPDISETCHRCPPAGWLSNCLVEEALLACSKSCETVVFEALAHISENEHPERRPRESSLKAKSTLALSRADLMIFQSIAVHGITCVYELLVRRHSLDRRFQNDTALRRLAAMVACPILSHSVIACRWLARLESLHRVRAVWLQCFICVLQECPETLLRAFIRSLCDVQKLRIHRFIRLLRLCSSTFQNFVERRGEKTLVADVDDIQWFLQETFNTICFAINAVVEEAVSALGNARSELQDVMTGVLDLLLHVLTTPQSPVTHLRAIGGALLTMESFGVDDFLETAGENLQHWLRVVLSLMNSSSLSVRSIAVDFTVSLFAGCFDCRGSLDEIFVVFATVLPEVAAREIALYSISNRLKSMSDILCSLWPLRRSIADIEDATPLDDDRIDPQLVPALSVFCRASQAILDGVIVELRMISELRIVGSNIKRCAMDFSAWDADEESLYEAACLFSAQTAPMQRVRWLYSLARLHESKQQWTEAAESMIACALSVTTAMHHIKSVWRPSRFALWSDNRRSHWLDAVGDDLGIPDRGNPQVLEFSEPFLEPRSLFGVTLPSAPQGRLPAIDMPTSCSIFVAATREAAASYDKESGAKAIALARFDELAEQVALVSRARTRHFQCARRGTRGMSFTARKSFENDSKAWEAAASFLDETILQIRLRSHGKLGQNQAALATRLRSPTGTDSFARGRFLSLRIAGKQPLRFQESTCLPTFLEFDVPCICRIPNDMLKRTGDAQRAALAVARRLKEDLMMIEPGLTVKIVDENLSTLVTEDESTTYLAIQLAEAHFSDIAAVQTRRFLIPARYLSKTSDARMTESTVAVPFPCPLSRQQVIFTSDAVSAPDALAG